MTPSTALLMDLHLPGVFGRGGSDDMEAWMSQEVTLCPIKTIFWVTSFVHSFVQNWFTCNSWVDDGWLTWCLGMLTHVLCQNAAIWAMSCSYLTCIPSWKIQTTDQPLLKCIQEKKQSAPKNLFQNMFWRLVPPVTLIQWRIQHPYRFPTAMTPCPRVPVWIKRWSATRSNISKNWCRLRTYPKAVVADSWPGR